MRSSHRRAARRGRARSTGLAAALGAALGASPMDAQDAARRIAMGADSVASTGAARDAQAAFERRRVALLPVTRGGAPCEVQIGRWCYWYDDREPHVPDEPVAIAAARERLLGALRGAVARAPGDAWVIGQYVRYLVEAGREADAAEAAGSCAAGRAWCDALLGYALHRGGDAGGAEHAFHAALAAMPSDSACRWLDPRPLVPRSGHDAFGESCASGDTLVARFWRLATPFLLRDGNDRRNEHLARRVLARLFADARTPYAARWSDDLEEMTLRYGWPDRWSRHRPASHATASADAVGHEPWPSYRFTPDADALDDPVAEPPPLGDRHAHERAAPPASRRIGELPLAASAFRRGDSLLVVAVAPPPSDSALAAYDSVALVVAPLDGIGSTATRVPLAAAPLVAATTASPLPSIVGLEALGDSSYALRARTVVEPPPTDRGFGVSDVLLFASDAGAAAGAAVPGSIDEALRTALPPGAIDGRTIGVFWELYGLGAGAHAVETALYIESTPPGWLSRAFTRLAGRSPAAPPRLRWTDVAAGGAVAARAILLDARLLTPGRHELVLEVRHPDGRAVRVRRALVVGDR